MPALPATFAGLTYFAGVITLLLAGLRIPAWPFGLSLLAGGLAAWRLSGDKVELGLPPLGALGFAGASFFLPAGPAAAVLGFCSGLVLVPLEAFLFSRGGRRLWLLHLPAGAVAATGAWVLAGRISPDRLPLVFGLLTLGGTLAVLARLPDFLIRFTLWLLTHSIYRIRILGRENVPARGPALLVANHISLADGLLVGSCLQRFVRFLAYRDYYYLPVLHWLLRRMKAIPIAGGDPKLVAESLERARQELRAGHVVCIFAEGAVSRTGNLLKFKRGFERILAGIDVPVIPVHLDRLWGSIFSFHSGRFFWKWPRQIPYPVTVSFGRPLPATATAHQVRRAVMELGAEAVVHRRGRRDLLHARFLAAARRNWFRFAMADSTGKELSYGGALTGALLLSGRLREHAAMVGVLLPASVGGALANLAVLFAGKIPVNLNFTAGPEAMQSAGEQCGLRQVLTSRAFLARAGLAEPPGAVYLEDLLGSFTRIQKLRAALDALFLYRPRRASPDSLATVIFSSGSTGLPKGVMLSHHNIVSNIESIAQVYWVTRQDRLMGVLPFFHSFGFTVTLWLPLLAGLSVVFHPNPVDAKTIGEMVRRYRATILAATPTFYQAYLRKCSREEFASLRYALAGAEKLREPLARAFLEKYGLPLLEGYGATEMSPVISVNVPDVEGSRERHVGFKPGTVGHPVPGVAVQVVDPETRRPLGPNEEGLLLVKGPNRMLGYLGQPEKTAEALDHGWYVTGDIAALDDDGFLRLTDRLSRFSKIGGEMVPHLSVEEAVNRLLGDACATVVSVPDEQRGERLVLFYACPGVSAAELWTRLCQSELPKLWIPKPGSIHSIEVIPTLGSGKVDLRRLRQMAEAG
jgi:acyl-[acyl-carrier-protein]-phospholipid O-acyltransferase/long-chain-fatty-acid--[acyl-carrier-protein] ligase